eukprot:SAG22_NODE_1049_length_5844_cov_2.122520_2_plen_199_part_00
MAETAPPPPTTSSATSTPPAAPPMPAEHVASAKYAVIGGSGVTIKSSTTYSFATPYGPVSDLGFLDEACRVVFVSRHNSTNIGPDGKPTYAPPHDVNFHAIIWALRHLNVKGVLAIGSTGTLHPKEVPVGSLIMPDDYFCVLPTPQTFWPHKVSMFEPGEGDVGRIHFTPALESDPAWSVSIIVRHRLSAVLPLSFCA